MHLRKLTGNEIFLRKTSHKHIYTNVKDEMTKRDNRKTGQLNITH